MGPQRFAIPYEAGTPPRGPGAQRHIRGGTALHYRDVLLFDILLENLGLLKFADPSECLWDIFGCEIAKRYPGYVLLRSSESVSGIYLFAKF